MFRKEKTTQAAARLIGLAGGRMPYIALLKLLYLADKAMLLQWGVPMTGDQWYAMPHGPVLSNTYDMIKAGSPACPRPEDYWERHLRRNGYDLELVEDPGDDFLSEAEEAVIDQVFAEHGGKDRWALVQHTHELPEWNDPLGSSHPIPYETVLEIEGRSAADIEALMTNIKAHDRLERAYQREA